MDTFEQQELVDRILAFFAQLDARGLESPAYEKAMREGMVRNFGDLKGEVFKPAMDVAMRHMQAEHEERQAILQTNMDLARKSRALMGRFPAAPTFGEAVRLGAAAGDSFALWVKQHPEILRRTIRVA